MFSTIHQLIGVVGGMTEVDLEAQLDEAGSEILLTIARYKSPKCQNSCQSDVWESIGLHRSNSDFTDYIHTSNVILPSEMKTQRNLSQRHA